MTQPGSDAWSAPMEPLTRVVREIEDLKRRMQQNEAERNALQAMVNGQQATLTALTTVLNGLAVQLGSASSSEGLFAPTNTATDRAATTVTTPGGFTQAIVIALCSCRATNTTGSPDVLQVTSVIEGVTGHPMTVSAISGALVVLAAPKVSVLTGLTVGHNISIATRVQTGVTWGVVAAAYVDAAVIFLR